MALFKYEIYDQLQKGINTPLAKWQGKAISGRALEVPGGSKNNVQLILKDVKENGSQLWRLLEAQQRRNAAGKQSQ